jgi:hypothetical protein
MIITIPVSIGRVARSGIGLSISHDDIHCFVSSQPPVPLMLQLYWPLFKAVALGIGVL